MIPDVFLPMRLRAGADGGLVARDVPMAVFFHGWPGYQANVEHVELWRERLLTRVVVDPSPLTLETLLDLGDAARPPLSAYLRAVGWPETAYPEAAAQVALAGAPRSLHADPAALVTAPHPTLARLLGSFAEQWHLNPVALWNGPVSEFLWLLALCRTRDGREPLSRDWVDEDGIGMEHED